jgi:hypothetical protein
MPQMKPQDLAGGIVPDRPCPSLPGGVSPVACTPLRTLLGLSLCLTWLAPIAVGQVPDKPAVKAAEPASGPLGDTLRFTRLGGWGGFGGMIGQFGLAKAMLVNNPAVQEELKLTADQKKDLREWEAQMRKRGETMFRGAGANPGQPPAQPGGPGGFNPFAMIETVTTLVREGEGSLAKILDKKQTVRLNQIALQMEGIAALGRPEMAEVMNLSPDQTQSIQEILNETKNNQLAFVMREGMAMRNRRPTDTPAATATAKAKADEAPVEDEEARAKARAANRGRMQAQVSKMRDGTDQIQNASNAKILKLLSRKQKERFDKLLGPPFDPAKFSGPTRPVAEAKAATVPAPVSTGKSTRLRDARGSSKTP